MIAFTLLLIGSLEQRWILRPPPLPHKLPLSPECGLQERRWFGLVTSAPLHPTTTHRIPDIRVSLAIAPPSLFKRRSTPRAATVLPCRRKPSSWPLPFAPCPTSQTLASRRVSVVVAVVAAPSRRRPCVGEAAEEVTAVEVMVAIKRRELLRRRLFASKRMEAAWSLG